MIAPNIANILPPLYYHLMNPLYIFAASIIIGIFLFYYHWKIRQLFKKAADAEFEALRFRRQSERLELALKQFAPEVFAQVKAKSDMEWQQAIKRLDAGELPILYPLESAFTPIGANPGH